MDGMIGGGVLPVYIHTLTTYARILDPASKFATWDRLDSYFERPDFDYQHILRFMDLLEENYDDYLAWLYKNSDSVIKRDASILYYDCTNFYCECEQPDEDVVDEVTGEAISGLRRFGVSKEHRPNPIVEMGLFMDSWGDTHYHVPASRQYRRTAYGSPPGKRSPENAG